MEHFTSTAVYHINPLLGKKSAETINYLKNQWQTNFVIPSKNNRVDDGYMFYPLIEPILHMKVPKNCLNKQVYLPSYIGVVCHYDNTPRRDFNSATIYDRKFYSKGTVLSFQHDMVEGLFFQTCCHDHIGKDENFMLINAWNEWGEGMVLEPSNVYNHSMLFSVFIAKKIVKKMNCQYEELLKYRNKHGVHIY